MRAPAGVRHYPGLPERPVAVERDRRGEAQVVVGGERDAAGPADGDVAGRGAVAGRRLLDGGESGRGGINPERGRPRRACADRVEELAVAAIAPACVYAGVVAAPQATAESLK